MPRPRLLLAAAGLLLAALAVPPAAAAPEPCADAVQPVPVVLVHGTFANSADSWGYAAPELRERGFCVFLIDYGGQPFSPFGGTGPVKDSAAELAAFLEDVLATTGAAQVDLVGHSQGGMMPRWYTNHLGGSDVVRHLVGLSSSNHGTDFNGLMTLGDQLPPAKELVLRGCPACQDQETGSPFLQELNAEGDIPAGSPVQHTVIQTAYDEVLTPYTSAFLDGADNVLLQDVCPGRPTEHVGMLYDPAVIQLAINALDPAQAEPVPC